MTRAKNTTYQDCTSDTPPADQSKAEVAWAQLGPGPAGQAEARLTAAAATAAAAVADAPLLHPQRACHRAITKPIGDNQAGHTTRQRKLDEETKREKSLRALGLHPFEDPPGRASVGWGDA
jgi:hypothetical protein